MKQAKVILPLLVLVVIALIVWLVLRSASPAPSTTQSPTTPTPHWGVQTKTSGCAARGPLPDSACTPGAIFPDVTKTQVCTPGYASSVRDVPQSLKNKVYASYGITKRRPGQYEVDHLVSLQLGGSNAIANLWPEAASPKPGFHEKDKVENYLNYEVCSGMISLQQAQIEIATNWLTVYERLPKKQGLAAPAVDATLGNEAATRLSGAFLRDLGEPFIQTAARHWPRQRAEKDETWQPRMSNERAPHLVKHRRKPAVSLAGGQ